MLTDEITQRAEPRGFEREISDAIKTAFGDRPPLPGELRTFLLSLYDSKVSQLVLDPAPEAAAA